MTAAHRRVVTGLPDPTPSLFEMSLDLITVAGFDGYYKKVNPAMTEILGWSWAELRSEPILHFVHPEDRAKTESEFERVQSHGVSIRHFENRMLTKIGDYRWISWKAQPDTSSRLVFATGRDVTLDRTDMDVGSSVNRLLQRIESLEQQNTQILRTRRPITGSSNPAAESDEDLEIAAGLKKGRTWLKVLGWVGGGLVAVVTAVFGAGAAYQKYLGGNATKDDIKTLEIQRIEPLETSVESLETGMAEVQTGVASLVETERKEKEMKRTKRKVARYDKQHQEAMQEYTADKASGRRTGPRPSKSEAHIDLEEALVDLEAKL